MKKSHLLGLLCTLVIQSSTTSASTIAATTTFSGGNTNWNPANSQVAGWDFTVDSVLTINALGIFDSGGDGILPANHGLALSHNIKIYDVTGPLITSAFIDAGTDDPLIEKTRWVQIPDVVLQPGVTYTIMADDMCVKDNNGGDGCETDFISYASGISLIEGYGYFDGEPLDLSARSSGDRFTVPNGFLGPNFAYLDEFSVVPVPAAMWLFGSGLLGLIGIARRKKT